MCGRFALYSSLDEIKEVFGIQQVDFQPEASYNIAPSQAVAVVVRHNGHNHLQRMIWGLVPSWAKDASSGARLINARAETLHQKPSFRRPLLSQRCLIVADGFFEWQKREEGRRPMFIHMKSRRPFGMAGLYDIWQPPEGERLISCTIITTQANDVVRPIHDRMPAIIPASHYSQWLDPSPQPVPHLLGLLKPYPAQEMSAYAVSRLGNSPHHNVPDCVRPAAA